MSSISDRPHQQPVAGDQSAENRSGDASTARTRTLTVTLDNITAEQYELVLHVIYGAVNPIAQRDNVPFTITHDGDLATTQRLNTVWDLATATKWFDTAR
jgi:hypothetical protein